MAHVAEHELAFGPKKLVVFHIAGHVGIGPGRSRRANQKRPRTPTNGHGFNVLFKGRVSHHGHQQLLLQQLPKRGRSQRGG